MLSLFYNYVDLIWIPTAFFVVDKKHRFLAAGFVVFCLVFLRMQYELMQSFGFHKEGLPGLMSSDPWIRGQITYSVIILLFILISIFSRDSERVIYLAASISVFFFAFITSTIIMSL